MNIQIARKRYIDVIRPDVMHYTQADFLATHVPMKNLYLSKALTVHAEPPEEDKKHPYTEEEVYERYMPEDAEDQFVLVIGDTGAGKSHLIRWMYSVHELRKAENEVVLTLKRADNTLKGTIRQLIELPEVKALPNRELYKKLASAATIVPEQQLKTEMCYYFASYIENDDGKGGEDDAERRIGRVERERLAVLFANSSFKKRITKDGGPIDRIYNKYAENKKKDVNDSIAEFSDEDFIFDADFIESLTGADSKAISIAKKMVGDDEFSHKITGYVNLFVEKVIQRCSNLEAGDLSNVIIEIRQELYKQNKTLTVFIEDITAASGVDNSLLDALLMDKREYSDKNMCRINSVVGTTDVYFREKFRGNNKGRIKKYVYVPDDMFKGDKSGLFEFFAKYLNAISLESETIRSWVEEDKASKETYPIHQATNGDGWGEYKYGEKTINLFPFTEKAILNLYNKQDIVNRNPRTLLQDVIEVYVQDVLDNFKEFPTKRYTFPVEDPTLLNAINNYPADDATRIRMRHFMYIWGDGKLGHTIKGGKKYVSGILTSVYDEIGLPYIDGEEVELPIPTESEENTGTEKTEHTPSVPSNKKDNETVLLALEEIDTWIEQKNYKLSVGASTKRVKPINDARKNMNKFLFETIDWASEGVPYHTLSLINEKNLVSFERQTSSVEAVVIVPACIDSRKIIESFIRWSEEGKGSWAFLGGTDCYYKAQRWAYSQQKKVIDFVQSYNGKKTNYFSYAVAAEFYRLILNGFCTRIEKAANLSPDLLLRNNKVESFENAHTLKWKNLLNIANSSKGEEARECVLQYYNLPQGDVSSSKNYEFDYVAFCKAVRKVVSTGLCYSDDDLQLDDPVTKRRAYSEHLSKILKQIPEVVAEEKKAIAEKMIVLSELIDLDEIESEDEVDDIIKAVEKFYNQATESQISVFNHKDQELISNCKKNKAGIYSAITCALKLAETDEDVDSLLLLSRDPMQKLQMIYTLVKRASDDVKKAQTETDNKIEEINKGKGNGSGPDSYSLEKKMIEQCKEMIEEVKKDVVE